MKYLVTINKETMQPSIKDLETGKVYTDNLKLEPYNRPDGLHLQLNYKKCKIYEEAEGKGIVQIPKNKESGKFETSFETNLAKSNKTSSMLTSNLFA